MARFESVVEVDRALGDLRLVGDGVHRGVLESVRAEHVPRRGHQFGPAEFVEDVFFCGVCGSFLAGDHPGRSAVEPGSGRLR